MRIDAIKADIESKIPIGVNRTVDYTYELFKNYNSQFYASYTPLSYHRTGALRNALEKQYGGNEGRIYYQLGGYSTGRKPSGEQVLSAAAWGGHGATDLKIVGGGVGIWDTPLSVFLPNWEHILVSNLRAAGIPLQ